MNGAGVGGRFEELYSLFRSEDGAQRQHARQSLVKMGSEVVPFLREHLADKNDRVRWEIAKTLVELKDPSTAHEMISLLADDVPGIRWLAAEGLINLGQDAIIPLLRGLQVHFHSTFFRESAHHILRELEQQELLDEGTRKTLEALEGPAPALSVPFAAMEALHAFRHT